MATPQKPFQTGAGVTNGSVASPFSTDPSLNARVAHCSVTMQETTNLLNQGGVWNCAYFPEFATAPLVNNASILPNYTIQNFNSQKYNRQYNGVVGDYNQPFLQWFPSAQEEMDFMASTAITDPSNNPFSGFACLFFNPATTTISMRITWKIGIEYNPNDAYRRYVETKPPTVHPNAPYDLTLLILDSWNKVALTTPGDLKDFLGNYSTLPGFNTIFNARPQGGPTHSMAGRTFTESRTNASGLGQYVNLVTE